MGVNTARWVALAVGLAVAGALSSCSSSAGCDAASCNGCCDSQGACQTGAQANACGFSGERCVSCSAGQSCQTHRCADDIAAGGGAGGGTAGGQGGGGEAGSAGGGTDGGTNTCDSQTCSDHCCNGECVTGVGTVNGCGASCQICPQPANATATCSATGCGFTCDVGSHLCGTQCLSDTSAGSCGTSCSPCGAQLNTTAFCDAGSCDAACNPGFHTCGAICAPDDSPFACGTSCASCPGAGAGFAPICDAGVCDLACAANYLQCGSSCLQMNSPATSCAANSCTACPSSSEIYSYCDAGACAPAGCTDREQHLCNSSCVPVDSLTQCGNACVACTPPPTGSAECDGVGCAVLCPLPLPDGGISNGGASPLWDCDGLASNGCESTVRCPLPTAGLVAEYLFSGDANNSASDAGAGTVVGATLTTDRKGTPNAAYAFDDFLGQYLSMASDPALPIGNQPRTISVWFAGPVVTGFVAIVNWGGQASGSRSGLSLESDQNLLFTGQDDDVIGTGVAVTDSLWHHLAMTSNGSKVAVFVDGVEVGHDFGLGLNTTPNTPLLVGAKVGLVGEYVKGSIDDLRIYDRALTASEIEALSKE